MFEFKIAENMQFLENEIQDLLTQVYVNGGYTEPQEAESLFESQSVKGRGILISARENKSQELAGMVIAVPPGSKAIRLAKSNEGELHLLAVRPRYRGLGLGRSLVEAAVEKAWGMGWAKIVLWTQATMKAAGRLYEKSGFEQGGGFERNGRQFLLYERALKHGQ